MPTPQHSRRAITPSDPVRLIAHETVFHGRLLDVHVDRIESPTGEQTTREIVTHPGAAAIVPVLPNGRVLLVRQYRHAVRSHLWEIPAGKVEPGESSISCAQRELREETGHVADRWIELASIVTSPGFSDERITVFHASDLRQIEPPGAHEIAEQSAFTFERIEQMILDCEIQDAKTILAIDWIVRRPPLGR